MIEGARIVVVEEAFVATGRGVLVAPRLTLADPPRGTFPVRLVFPDGASREAIASIDVAHMRGALAPYAMVRLPELAPADVPPGTEIWRIG